MLLSVSSEKLPNSLLPDSTCSSLPGCVTAKFPQKTPLVIVHICPVLCPLSPTSLCPFFISWSVSSSSSHFLSTPGKVSRDDKRVTKQKYLRLQVLPHRATMPNSWSPNLQRNDHLYALKFCQPSTLGSQVHFRVLSSRASSQLYAYRPRQSRRSRSLLSSTDSHSEPMLKPAERSRLRHWGLLATQDVLSRRMCRTAPNL